MKSQERNSYGGTIGAGVQDRELFETMAKHDAITVGGTNMVWLQTAEPV